MNIKSLKIVCLSVLMMGSALQAMDSSNRPLRLFDSSPYRRLSLNDQLILAADKGDKQEVEALLCKRVNVNARDISGLTVLHIAAKYNHKEICELLISHGADVNGVDKSGMTVLMIASGIEMRKFLIDKGADVNMPKDRGITPLMDAAARGDDEMCKLFLANGASMHAVSENGSNALMWASYRDHVETGKLLIRQLVNPTKKQQDSLVALLGAAKRRRAAQPLLVGRDVVGMLAQAGQVAINEIKRQNKIKAECEIKKIEFWESRRSALLQYLNSL